MLNVMVLAVDVCVTPLKVTPHVVPDGRLLSWKVTVATKFAVMVPGPLMVAVAVADFALSIVIDEVFVLHWLNIQPELAVVEIWIEPAVIQTFVPDGLVVPAPLGARVKDT